MTASGERTAAPVPRRVLRYAVFLSMALAPAAQAATPRDRILSDEVRRTYWVHAETRGALRVAPDASSRSLGRLHLDTEDGLPEVYIALRRFVDGDGRRWLKLRIPGRHGPPRAWVRASALSAL